MESDASHVASVQGRRARSYCFLYRSIAQTVSCVRGARPPLPTAPVTAEHTNCARR